MRVAGPIYALDLGQRTGFAVGPAGSAPRSGTVILKLDNDPRRTALGNLIAFLNDEWSAERPALVVAVPPPTIQAHVRMHHREPVARAEYGLSGILEGMCNRFGLPYLEKHEDSVRKHFIGKGRLGDRQATKAAVVARCHLLQLLPRDCFDDDRADALALHDWAAATYGGRAAFALFGEGEHAAAGM